MRWPRPHRLTGSVRRLLAAAALAVVGAAAIATVASASVLGLDLTLPNLGPPVSGLPLPSLPGATTAPTPPTPTLPGGVPTVCAANCGPTPGGSTAVARPPGGTQAAGPVGGGGRQGSSPGGRSQSVGGSGLPSSAISTATPPRSAGLSLSAPPPVEPLTPLAGISFGQAPYLWPLFLLLDVIAAAAVVLVVRKTWSPAPGAD